MLKSNPLAALTSTFGRRKGKASRLSQRKGGPLADARANVDRVHTQVRELERSCEWHKLAESHPTKRIVSGFFAAVRLHGPAEDRLQAVAK